ncbi:MAG: nucleoside triphosphate pyrophosphohydrolase [Saccharofermentanales bacterium]
MIDIKKDVYRIEDLLALMEYLRGENGCPWDKEQTHKSIRNNVIEEAYEVVDAIDDGDPDRLADELGDLLLQVIFHSQISRESGEFDFSEVADHLSRKLISRHTHIFGENPEQADSAEMVLEIWNKNKKKEKKITDHSHELKDIPRNIPALMRAFKIQKKARKAGLDIENTDDVLAKIAEEIEEIREAAENPDDETRKMKTEHEIGDLLFAVVNYARFLGVDPEIALDKSNQKFIRRFEEVEKKVSAGGRKMEQLPISELDMFWDEVKAEEES